MRFSSSFLTLALVASAAAKGGMNKTLSEKGQCKEMQMLTKLNALANNQTALDLVTKGNTTKADAIKAKATAGTATLDTLMSNSTLMMNCAIIDAAQAEENSCQETFALQDFMKFASNTTAVAAKTNNNQTEIDAIAAQATKAQTKLTELTSNSTLQAACPAVMQKDQCKAMDGLMKLVATANNQTLLEAKTKGNTTKEDKIKAQAVKVQTKLDAMMNNATFMAACSAISAESQKGTSGSTTGNSISSTNMKSAAMILQMPGLSTLVVVALGMLML